MIIQKIRVSPGSGSWIRWIVKAKAIETHLPSSSSPFRLCEKETSRTVNCRCQQRYLSSSSTLLADSAPIPEEKVPESASEVEPAPQKKRRKAAKKSEAELSAASKEVLNYVGQHSGVKPGLASVLLPRQFLRPKATVPTSVYLVNKSVAAQIAEIISNEDLDLSSPVLELHPGLGLLTSELINTVGFRYVTCLEDNAVLAEDIRKNFGLTVIDSAIDDLPRHYHLDKHDGNDRIHKLLEQITTGKEKEEEEEPGEDKPLCMVGVLPHISVVNFLIRSYVSHRVFFEEGTPWSGAGVTLLVGLGSKVDLVCFATRQSGLVAYRPTSVLFQTLFKAEELGQFPRQAFIPWEIQDRLGVKGPKSRKLKGLQPDIVKFYRIQANLDTVERIGKENLFSYWYFVRQILFARTNRIIPEFEKWVPGCGMRLIKQGHTIFSQFGELTPDQILNLYLEFVSWLEFTNSSFLNAVEKFQTRLEISEEDG